jgi:hypothetical protein
MEVIANVNAKLKMVLTMEEEVVVAVPLSHRGGRRHHCHRLLKLEQELRGEEEEEVMVVLWHLVAPVSRSLSLTRLLEHALRLWVVRPGEGVTDEAEVQIALLTEVLVLVIAALEAADLMLDVQFCHCYSQWV